MKMRMIQIMIERARYEISDFLLILQLAIIRPCIFIPCRKFVFGCTLKFTQLRGQTLGLGSAAHRRGMNKFKRCRGGGQAR